MNIDVRSRGRASTFRRAGWLAVAALVLSALALPGVASAHSADVTCTNGQAAIVIYDTPAGSDTYITSGAAYPGGTLLYGPVSNGSYNVANPGTYYIFWTNWVSPGNNPKTQTVRTCPQGTTTTTTESTTSSTTTVPTTTTESTTSTTTCRPRRPSRPRARPPRCRPRRPSRPRRRSRRSRLSRALSRTTAQRTRPRRPRRRRPRRRRPRRRRPRRPRAARRRQPPIRAVWPVLRASRG